MGVTAVCPTTTFTSPSPSSASLFFSQSIKIPTFFFLSLKKMSSRVKLHIAVQSVRSRAIQGGEGGTQRKEGGRATVRRGGKYADFQKVFVVELPLRCKAGVIF